MKIPFMPRDWHPCCRAACFLPATAIRTLMCLLPALFATQGRAQSPTDALMMPDRNACILLGYDYGTFDRYWEGAFLRENQTIATVQQETFLPMAAVNVVSNLDAYLSLPYISTASSEPNGGRFAGAEGFQDIGLALKYKALDKPLGAASFRLFAGAGFSTPLTNYLSDYRPYSIGFGAPEFSLRLMPHYEWNNGLYLRGMASHLWRGYTKAERDYYYADGSYYTAWMDVPNAWNFQGVVGKWFFGYRLKVEGTYTTLRSTGGDDIRSYNAPQPTNKTEFDRLGLSAQYYFKNTLKGLGFIAYHNRVVNGRNVPKVYSTGFGLTYQFNYISNKNDDQANAQ